MKLNENGKGNGLKDLALFGRILSTGLVVAGYAWLGAWGSGWLEANGYPSWLSFAALPAAAAFGLWQGWLCLTKGRRLFSKEDNAQL